MQPTHQDLQPYCEIYHLVKTAPGAKILSLGTASGVYIGYVPTSHLIFHLSPRQTNHPTPSQVRTLLRFQVAH